MPEFLTLDDVLESHAEQIAQYGGIEGVRDIGLLESALAQPESMFGGQYLHADIFAMAAAYMFHLTKNHPFMDGNKRVGLESALVFLEINGHTVDASDEELVDLTLSAASGQSTKQRIADFFRTHVA